MSSLRHYRRIAVSCVVAVAVCGVAGVRAQSQQVAPIPHRIDLVISPDAATIPRLAPAILKVTVVNRGQSTIEVNVCDDGAPAELRSMVGSAGGDLDARAEHMLRFDRNRHKISLEPGSAVSGEVLIVFGPPGGFAFESSGTYRVRLAHQPDPRLKSVESNDVLIEVKDLGLDNRAFLEELTDISVEYFGYDMGARSEEKLRPLLSAAQLLRKILSSHWPDRVKEDASTYEKRRAELKASLSELIERYPDESYTPYIAQYLGLIELDTFEYLGSVGNFDERGVTLAERIEHENYKGALRYLTIASDSNCWPRILGPSALARLFTLAHQWEESKDMAHRLRSEFGDIGGSRAADRASAMTDRYRAKCEAHDR